MNLQKNYVLIPFAILLLIGFGTMFQMGILKDTNIFPGVFWDAVSAIIAIGGPFLLLLGTFAHTTKISKDLFIYKLIWTQEIFITFGLIGTVIGVSLILSGMEIAPPPGVDPIAKLIGSMAIALITLIYGLGAALVFYLFQKYYEMKNDKMENLKIDKPKEGFLILSFMYFIFSFILVIFASILGAINAGISPLATISVKNLIIVVLLLLIFFLFYKGNSILNLVKNLFWYYPDKEKNIQYNLKYIRNMKKIASFFICIPLFFAPVVMLASTLFPAEDLNTLGYNYIFFIGLKNGSFQFIYILDVIVLLTMIEGREVSKLYFVTGNISAGDRYYTLKYILGPAFLLFLTYIVGIILSFII